MGGTLKITGLSLLLGAVLLLASLSLLDPGSWRASSPVPSLDLANTTVLVNNQPAAATDGSLQLTFSKHSNVNIELKFSQPLDTDRYRYLHIAVQEQSPQARILIVVKSAGTVEPLATVYPLEDRNSESLWINTHELPGWTGTVESLSLSVWGAPDSEGMLEDFSIHGPAIGLRLAAIISDWTNYEPWDRAAMNTYTGVTQVSSFYPLILAAGWLLCSLTAYAALALTTRRRNWNWQVIGLMFLVCWLSLDLAWQQRLLSQLQDTRAQFAGLTTQEKLRVGPDKKLISLVEQMHEHIPPGSRIFVASLNDYKALRTAYYLYPLNVYWKMQGRPPKSHLLKSGDFILLMAFPDTKYRPWEDSLFIPHTGTLSVDQLLRVGTNSLYRLR